MTNLTETAYHARRIINWAILVVIAYILLRIFWSIFFTLWIAISPPKAPPPNHAFGKLPAITFPNPSATPSGELTFRLETIEGSVPPASPSAAVYFMPKNPPNFLGLPKTQEFAKRLNFDLTPVQESKNIYRFNDPTTPLRRLRYDIISNNFILRYDFEQDPGVFVEKNLPTPDAAKAQARNLLQTYDLYNDGLSGGEVQVTFLKLIENKLIPTSSVSQADSMRVDFFRSPIGQSPIVTHSPIEAPISIIFSGSTDEKKRILQFAYTLWPIDFETRATYPLKLSSLAWQELQGGGGFIARYPTLTSTVVVRSVYLAYYDSLEPQSYLQPIFVFEGDEGFLGYVSAVSPEWVE